MNLVLRYASLVVIMANEIQCAGDRIKITLESLVGIIAIIGLLILLVLGICLIIRKYREVKQIRAEMPQKLHDIFQQFGNKDKEFHSYKDTSRPNVHIRVLVKAEKNLAFRCSQTPRPDAVIQITNKQVTSNTELLKQKQIPGIRKNIS